MDERTAKLRDLVATRVASWRPETITAVDSADDDPFPHVIITVKFAHYQFAQHVDRAHLFHDLDHLADTLSRRFVARWRDTLSPPDDVILGDG